MRIGIEGLPLLFHRTGTATYTHELVQHLRRLQMGDSVILFGRNQRGAGESYHDISYAERVANFLYKEYRLPAELAERGIDIYHSPRDMGLPDPGRLPCPCVMTLHDVILVRLADDYYSPARAKMYERRLLAKVNEADHIITVSGFSKKDLCDWSGIDPDKVSVVHNGVSKQFSPVTDPDILDTVRRRYRLPKRFVFCVGSTEPRKNIRRAIEAFGQLRRVRADIQMVIAGVDYCRVSPGEAFEGLDLDGVVLTGFVQDVDLPAIYTMADLFFFPSLYEGFGLPPLEAMACGTPVITSSKSSIPEVVGDAAVLVDPRKPGEMAGALEMVLSSDSMRQELTIKGFERASGFSWDRTAQQTREIYARVINRR